MALHRNFMNRVSQNDMLPILVYLQAWGEDLDRSSSSANNTL